MSDITPPKTPESPVDFSQGISSYKGQQPGTFSTFKPYVKPSNSIEKSYSVGSEVYKPEIIKETQRLAEIGRKAEAAGIEIKDNGEIDLPGDLVDQEQVEREAKLEEEVKILRNLVSISARFEVVKVKLSELYTEDLDQQIKTELISESQEVEKEIDKIKNLLSGLPISEIDKKIKILEEKIEKIHGELKSKVHSVSEIPVSKIDIKKEENIIEINTNKYNWDILDITPKNIFIGDDRKFYIENPSGDKLLTDQELWRSEHDNFVKDWESYINFINSDDAERKKAYCKKLINLKNEVLDALSDGKIKLAITKHSNFSTELKKITDEWPEISKKLSPINVVSRFNGGNATPLKEWREREEAVARNNMTLSGTTRGEILRDPGNSKTSSSYARLINKGDKKAVNDSASKINIAATKQIYSPMIDPETHIENRTGEEKINQNISKPEIELSEIPHSGGMTYSINMPKHESMATPNPEIKEAKSKEKELENKEKLEKVGKLMDTRSEKLGKDWRKWALVLSGIAAISTGTSLFLEKEKSKTPDISLSSQQKEGLKEFVNQIVDETPEGLVKKLFPEIVNPNNPSNVLDMKTERVVGGEGSVYGLDYTKRKKLSDFISNLKKASTNYSTSNTDMASKDTTIRALIELIKSKAV